MILTHNHFPNLQVTVSSSSTASPSTSDPDSWPVQPCSLGENGKVNFQNLQFSGKDQRMSGTSPSIVRSLSIYIFMSRLHRTKGIVSGSADFIIGCRSSYQQTTWNPDTQQEAMLSKWLPLYRKQAKLQVKLQVPIKSSSFCIVLALQTFYFAHLRLLQPDAAHCPLCPLVWVFPEGKKGDVSRLVPRKGDRYSTSTNKNIVCWMCGVAKKAKLAICFFVLCMSRSMLSCRSEGIQAAVLAKNHSASLPSHANVY